jgi:HK97 gp10 family phage protein
MSNPEKYSAPLGASKIRIEGMDDIMRNLKKLLTSHTEAEIKKAIKPGADILIKAAKQKITTNDSVDTGVLRDSIKILPKWRQDPLGIYVGPRVKRRKRKQGETGKISDSPYYAHWVEYGTDPHNLGYKGKFVSAKGADHKGAKKHPYMRPAYDENKMQIINAMQDGIIKMLEAKHF